MCLPAVVGLIKNVGQAFGLVGADPSAPPAQPDPAAERAKAEADAANAANATIAGQKQQRRANTLGSGGPVSSLGATQSAVTSTPKTSVLGGGAQ